MTENEIQASIIEYIRRIGGYCQRVNSGSMFSSYANKKSGDIAHRRVKMADKGTPDILACINGKFIAIEVKRDLKAVERWQKAVSNFFKTGKLTKSNEGAVHQLWEAEKIQKAGGLCIMVNSIDRLDQVLFNLKIINKKTL